MNLKPLRHILEYGLFLIGRAAVTPLTSIAVYRLGRGLGRLLYHASLRRRRVGRTNLDLAFQEGASASEKNRILRESFMQMGVSILQFLWVSHSPRQRVAALIAAEPEGLDLVRECLSRGKGILFLTAHFGNWEVMGLHHGYLGVGHLYSIARRLDNPYLERFVFRLRTLSGNGIFYRDENPIRMIRALKGNGCVAVMMDQNAGDWGTFVNFFGQKASTSRSLPLLSYKRGTPILPMFCYPVGEGRYRITYGPELKLEKTGDKNRDVEAWTQTCVRQLEMILQKNPEPWMWVHRRWKSRPGEEPRGWVYR
ncbi:MAG: lysophospholipid acyltransferase family protein [Nitrospinaceae bacterium]